ncbi:MAG: gspD, partial [Proteobacteria bacterium]|nr:gspD [Pseudomonadota bacterium]
GDDGYGSSGFSAVNEPNAAFATGSNLDSSSTSGRGAGSTGSSSSGGFGSGSSFGGGAGSSGRRAGARGATAMDLGRETRVVADPANNALIIFAKPADYKEIEAVIKELDVMPMQVLIDATVVEVSLKGELQYGLRWYFEHRDMGFVRGNPTSSIAQANLAGGFTYSMVNAAKDIRVQLDLLAANNKVNVLSSPSLMVLNNQEAQINVGDKVPTPTATASNVLPGAATTTLTSTLQYQESGTSLRLKPRVNAGGLVIMDVMQEISTPSKVTVNNTDTFQFAQRKIHSTVAVPDGESLALGGLIQDRESDAVTGIPILSQIPYLGWLFSTTIKSKERTELIVLLTPRTVNQKPDITRVTNEFRRRLTGFGNLESAPTETKPYNAP